MAGFEVIMYGRFWVITEGPGSGELELDLELERDRGRAFKNRRMDCRVFGQETDHKEVDPGAASSWKGHRASRG
jgi:hypothetical protein